MIHQLNRGSGHRLRGEGSKAQEALLLAIECASPAPISNIGGIEACLNTRLVGSSVERDVPAAVELEDFQAFLRAIELALVIACCPKVLFRTTAAV